MSRFTLEEYTDEEKRENGNMMRFGKLHDKVCDYLEANYKLNETQINDISMGIWLALEPFSELQSKLKAQQELIDRLEKAYAEAMNILNSDELLRQHMNFIGYRELDKLKEQLKKKDQIIEKAEKALNNYAIADDVGAIARQYFNDKQKDEVKCD